MTSKKEWVLKVFQGEAADRVPVGFWHHFTRQDEWTEGFGNPEIFQKNLTGHQQFLQAAKPDFIKLMSDGFFTYPNPVLQPGSGISDLKAIQPIGQDHAWFAEQVDLVRQIKASFPEDILAIYNVFAPATHLKWQLAGQVVGGDERLADLLAENPQVVSHALGVIAEDLALLTQKIVTEAGIEGIYFSVQTIQDPRVSAEVYRSFIAPSERRVLEAANQAGKANCLHICGYEGAKNDLQLFTDYPAQVVNWAVKAEGVSLAEGRKLFQGKTVLGGFENGQDGLLYAGSKAEVQAEARRLLTEAGREGLVIGADCTVPADIDPERFAWVRSAVAD